MTEQIHSSDPADSSPWESLGEPLPTYEEVAERERTAAVAELKTLGAEYRAIERDFIEKQPAAKTKFADDPGKQAGYDKFFIRKYEGKISFNRFLATSKAKLARVSSPYTLAQYEDISLGTYSHRERSVEAQSGILYTERLAQLESAIEAAGGNAEHTKLLRQSWPLVRDHVFYENIMQDRTSTYESIDRSRTEAHNLVIEHLNSINDLARQYGTEPFTCRNFQTSRHYNQRADLGGALANTLRSDRTIVRQYFGIVFNTSINELLRKIETNGMRY